MLFCNTEMDGKGNKEQHPFYLILEQSFHVLQNIEHQTSWKSLRIQSLKRPWKGFPGGAVVESLPANAEDAGSSPGLGGSHMPRSN